MKVDEKLIRHVAEVARLNLSDGEIKEFLPQLQEILNSFSELDKVDTGGLKPSFQPVLLKDALREDIEEECLSKEEALANTSHKKDGYFRGPKAV
ncbi:MAG TPA: Asp-tRNA(Asn)/Glu-tRNA(Gln) amidotransferase subunit GatC [Candidatus Nanoarchaeia archaeon]|nr:Asp-tRNA(Asn)/Glu-tRNA(Gln) amidotransferase subunit GatC [Candidatus Nanoarchaeia archaeon]